MVVFLCEIVTEYLSKLCTPGEVVPCLPHQFQCGSRECLEPSQLCNGMTNCADGSDEGGSCQINCAEKDEKRCSQRCYNTPQGTVRTLCKVLTCRFELVNFTQSQPV